MSDGRIRRYSALGSVWTKLSGPTGNIFQVMQLNACQGKWKPAELTTLPFLIAALLLKRWVGTAAIPTPNHTGPIRMEPIEPPGPSGRTQHSRLLTHSTLLWELISELWKNGYTETFPIRWQETWHDSLSNEMTGFLNASKSQSRTSVSGLAGLENRQKWF